MKTQQALDKSLCLKAMLWVAAVVLGPAACMAQAMPTAETCAPITSDEVEVLFARWAKALRTGHPDRVTRNYAPDACWRRLQTHPGQLTLKSATTTSIFCSANRACAMKAKIRIGCNVATDHISHLVRILNFGI